MKLALANNVYIVPETGLPVEGRMTVYVHDSGVLADVFTLDNADYVAAQNPQLLHAGLPAHTLFTETGVYDIVVERYIGEEGHMSAESPGTDFVQCGDYETGLDFSLDNMTSSTVDTVSELRDVSPELGMVTVNGYFTSRDCIPRTYIWDAASQDEEDGGYVISSNESDEGNWILLWDDEIMPASVYGVKAGEESNMSLLLSYPSTVGSFALKTAPCVRFPSGNYSVNLDFSTDKELCFDAGAKFLHTKFTCPKARVFGRVSQYVADFSFTSPDAEAHSCWFRTVQAFWACGAKTMTIDADNYMTDTWLYSYVTLSGVSLHAATQLATQYTEGTYIRLENVHVEGRPFRRGSDYVIVADSSIGDGIFTGSASDWDPGLISDGHRVQFQTSPDLRNFESTKAWYAVMHERRERAPAITTDTIDFENRPYSGQIDLGSFTTLRNVRADSVRASATSCVMENVVADVYVDAETSTAMMLNNCKVNLYTWDGLASLGGNSSEITVVGATGLDPADTVITWNGGKWTGKIWLSDEHAETYAKANLVSFNGTSFPVQWNWRVNCLGMRSCFGGVKVDLLPYVSGSDYLYELTLLDNVFAGSTRFWMTMYGTASAPYTEIAGHAKFGAFCVSGNQFRGSDPHPFKMLRIHPYSVTTYIADDPGVWEFSDNTGNAPLVSPEPVNNSTAGWSAAEVGPDAYYYNFLPATSYMFCPWFHANGIDYMYECEKPGMVRMGEWVGYFPGVSSQYNYHVLGALKVGPSASDLLDEDENNMFVNYVGFTISDTAISDLTKGRLMWPRY